MRRKVQGTSPESDNGMLSVQGIADDEKDEDFSPFSRKSTAKKAHQYQEPKAYGLRQRKETGLVTEVCDMSACMSVQSVAHLV